jgi:hypothetical protein
MASKSAISWWVWRGRSAFAQKEGLSICMAGFHVENAAYAMDRGCSA